MSQPSDQEILDLFRDESTQRQAFTMLVNRYKKRLYWLIRKIVINHDDTDDVLQNTFIKIWKGLPFFREDSGLYSWIYRIAYNESLTFLKNRKKELALASVAFNRYLENQLCDQRNISCSEIEEKLQKALLQLPEKQRIVFHLRYYDELQYDEISRIFGTSIGALKASYHLAMKKIEKYMLED